jgi:hypothetical protein
VSVLSTVTHWERTQLGVVDRDGDQAELHEPEESGRVIRYELPGRVGADQIVDRVTAKITGQTRSPNESQIVEEQQRGPSGVEDRSAEPREDSSGSTNSGGGLRVTTACGKKRVRSEIPARPDVLERAQSRGEDLFY